ncbi:hypothetical protein LJC59_08960 [Desulfovibrio sp. OttesenSCG-928-A18]|nr:hypothetical protein [Desulfovibrio sp. OttesenSCG-928-A18]
MQRLYFPVIALLMALFSFTPVHAAKEPDGPAQQAAEQWLAQTEATATVHLWQIFYDKTGTYAVAVATYSLPDEGNMVHCAVAVLRKEKTGTYTFIKEAKPANGEYGQTENVRFEGKTAFVSAKVLRENDPRCCPTGEKTWKITLP